MRYSILKALSVISAAVGTTFIAQNAHASVLPVSNPGFEDLTGSDPAYFSSGLLLDGHLTASSNPTNNSLIYVTANPIPSWTADTSAGGTMNPASTFITPESTDGQNVAYSSGSIIEQTLTFDILPSTHYILTVDVGHPNLPSVGFNYHVWLSSGGFVLGEDANSVSIPLNSWDTSTVTWDSPGDVPDGSHLTINLASNAGVAVFDHVQIFSGSLAPEPGLCAFLLAPLATLLTRRRGR